MHIAICDDDIHELALISALIEEFRELEDPSITYEVFNSPKSLLAKVKKHEFDFLLLDIVMPEMTGIELAHAIRTIDKHIPLVFLTTSPEFAIASYRVKATDYLLKPVQKQLLHEILKEQLRTDEEILLVKTSDSLTQLAFSEIVYIEVAARKIYIYLTDGTILQALGTLAEYEELLLKSSHFYKPHRSYVVNLQHMSKLDKDGFHTILGNVLPVPKPNIAKTKTIYMDYLMS